MKKADLLQLVRSWQEQLDAAMDKLPESVSQGQDQEPAVTLDHERRQAERAGEYVSLVGLMQVLEKLKGEIETLQGEVEKAQKKQQKEE